MVKLGKIGVEEKRVIDVTHIKHYYLIQVEDLQVVGIVYHALIKKDI